MHWQYYQKAIAAYFAASNALTIRAQEQMPFVIPGDGGTSYPIYRLIWVGTQADSVFSGIATFGRIPYRECFGRDKHEKFDIAILGAPFDTATSYRYLIFVVPSNVSVLVRVSGRAGSVKEVVD